MVAENSPTLCIIIKNAPRGTRIQDITTFLLMNGSDAIHRARMHTNSQGFSMFFIYYYSVYSAINATIYFNNAPYYGIYLHVRMHREAKDDIMNMLWGEEDTFTLENLIQN